MTHQTRAFSVIYSRVCSFASAGLLTLVTGAATAAPMARGNGFIIPQMTDAGAIVVDLSTIKSRPSGLVVTTHTVAPLGKFLSVPSPSPPDEAVETVEIDCAARQTRTLSVSQVREGRVLAQAKAGRSPGWETPRPAWEEVVRVLCGAESREPVSFPTLAAARAAYSQRLPVLEAGKVGTADPSPIVAAPVDTPLPPRAPGTLGVCGPMLRLKDGTLRGSQSRDYRLPAPGTLIDEGTVLAIRCVRETIIPEVGDYEVLASGYPFIISHESRDFLIDRQKNGDIAMRFLVGGFQPGEAARLRPRIDEIALRLKR